MNTESAFAQDSLTPHDKEPTTTSKGLLSPDHQKVTIGTEEMLPLERLIGTALTLSHIDLKGNTHTHQSLHLYTFCS